MDSTVKDTLRELRQRLKALYGERLAQVILYGSQTHSEAIEDSDIDVAVVLNGPFDYWEELRRTEETVANLCLEQDVVISTVFLTPEETRFSKHPLAVTIRHEGITL